MHQLLAEFGIDLQGIKTIGHFHPLKRRRRKCIHNRFKEIISDDKPLQKTHSFD